MKVKATFNVSKRVLDKILKQIGSKELKNGVKNYMSIAFAPLDEQQPRITNLKLEVSE